MELFQTSSLDPHGLQEEMRSSLPHLLKQNESSFQVILGKRREFLSSSELPYLLVSRLFLQKMEATLLLARAKGDRAPLLPKRKVLYLIFDKRRLRASPNLMVQKKASSQQSRQAPPI